MKLSKKILFSAIALTAMAFVGCKMGEGDGKLSGSKWDATLTKDSTEVGVEEASPAYGRFFKQLGTGEKVQSIKTTITVETEGIDGYAEEVEPGLYKAIESGTKEQEVHGVVGFIFDLHKTKAEADNENVWKKGDTLYDFIIVGYRPSDKGFYVERYVDIPEGSMDEFVTTSAFAPTAKEYFTNTESSAFEKGTYDSEVFVDAEAKTHSFTVTVLQSEALPGSYVIMIGDKLVATYEGTIKNEKGLAIGGAAAYANAPVGTIVKATFESDKNVTVGLFAEVVEE